MKTNKVIYLIGSLRNERIPELARKIRPLGYEVFDEWMAAGPIADDCWQKYSDDRGHSYREALEGYAAKHVFDFDKYHLDRSDIAVLVLPAGKSGHLELGYMAGKGKQTFVLFPDLKELAKLPDKWQWVAGIYEGEGSISVLNIATKKNLQIQLTSTDFDVIQKLHEVTGKGRVQGPYLDTCTNLVKKPPNLKPKWRWAVYKKQDILYVLNGIMENLCSRRQEQIKEKFETVGWSLDELKTADDPLEFRYDVMYQFADKVLFNDEELLAELSAYSQPKQLPFPAGVYFSDSGYVGEHMPEHKAVGVWS